MENVISKSKEVNVLSKDKKVKVVKPHIVVQAESLGKQAPDQQITPWPKVRNFGIPNKMLRSALFGIQRERAGVVPVDDMVILCPEGTQIKYSGPVLNQDDSLVWQMIVRAIRQNKTPMGGLIQLSSQEMLNVLERTDGGANFIWLKSCLERLTKAYIMIDTPNDEIRSHLLVGYRVDKKTKKIDVGISSLLYPLFIGDLTDVDVIRKTKLKSQLSRWLHDFYSSHSDPVPYTIQRIQELSRSNKQTSKFRKMVESAIEELKECEPPLFAKESHLDAESDQLIIYKATNSPGEAPKKGSETIKADLMLESKGRGDNEIQVVMHRFNMKREDVVAMNIRDFKKLLNMATLSL